MSARFDKKSINYSKVNTNSGDDDSNLFDSEIKRKKDNIDIDKDKDYIDIEMTEEGDIKRKKDNIDIDDSLPSPALAGEGGPQGRMRVEEVWNLKQTRIKDLSQSFKDFLKSPKIVHFLNGDQFDENDSINTRKYPVTLLELVVYAGYSLGMLELTDCQDLDLESELFTEVIYSDKLSDNLKKLSLYNPETTHLLDFAIRRLNHIRERLPIEEETKEEAEDEVSNLEEAPKCDPSGFSVATPMYNDVMSGRLFKDYAPKFDNRFCTGKTFLYLSAFGCFTDLIHCVVTHTLCAPWMYCNPNTPVERYLGNRQLRNHESRFKELQKEEEVYIQFIGKLTKRCLDPKPFEVTRERTRTFLHYIESQFHIAVKKGDLSLVAAMLKNGVDPNLSDRKGNLALIEAVQSGNGEMVTLLLEAGAKIYLANQQDLTALQMAQELANDANHNNKENRKQIYSILMDVEDSIRKYGASQLEVMRGIRALKIHVDDFPRYLSVILKLHRDKMIELRLPMSMGPPKFLAELISDPETTRKVILQILRAADIPNMDENRYTDLIMTARNRTAASGSAFTSIAGYLEEVLRTEARRPICDANVPVEEQEYLLEQIVREFRAQISAPYMIAPVLADIADTRVASYVIDRYFDIAKIHADDLQRYGAAMMARRFEILPPNSVQKPRSIPALAVAAVPQITRELALAEVGIVAVPILYQDRYAELICEAHHAEIASREGCHSIAWHCLQVIAREAVRRANLPEPSADRSQALVNEIMQKYSALGAILQHTFEKLDEVADTIVTRSEINRLLDIAKIHSDDRPRYCFGIEAAHREEVINFPLDRRRRTIVELAAELIPEITRKLALQAVNNLVVPADKMDNYAILIVDSFNAETADGHAHQSIESHFQKVLQRCLQMEAREAVHAANIAVAEQEGLINKIIAKYPEYKSRVPYRLFQLPVVRDTKETSLADIAQPMIVDFKINRELDSNRIHPNDRPRFFKEIMEAYHAEVVQEEAILKPRRITRIANNVILKGVREVAQEAIVALNIPESERQRYVDLVFSAYVVDTGVMAGTRNPIASYLESVLREEVLEVIEAAQIPPQGHEALIGEIIGKYKSQISNPYLIVPNLSDIATNKILKHITDLAFDQGKIHYDDRQQYRIAMMSNGIKDSLCHRRELKARLQNLDPRGVQQQITPTPLLTLAVGMLPQATRALILEKVRIAAVPVENQNRYVDLIFDSHTAENVGLGVHRSLNWHFEQVLQREVAQEIVTLVNIPLDERPNLVNTIIQKFRSLGNNLNYHMKELTEVARNVIVEYEINLLLNSLRIHQNDRAKYFDVVLTAYRANVVEQPLNQLLNSLTVLTFEMVPQITKDLILEAVRALCIPSADENHYQGLSLEMHDASEGDPQPIVWYVEQVLRQKAVEILKAENILEESQPALIDKIIHEFKSKVADFNGRGGDPHRDLSLAPVFNNIVQTLIEDYKINSLLDIARIHPDDRARFFNAIDVALRQGTAEAEMDAKTEAEMAFIPRRKMNSGFVFMMIAKVTRELALEALRAIHIPPVHEEYYVDLVISAYQEERIRVIDEEGEEAPHSDEKIIEGEGTRQPIAKYLDKVLWSEARKAVVAAEIQVAYHQKLIEAIIQQYKAEIVQPQTASSRLSDIAERMVVESIINDALDEERVHADDRPRYKKEMLARCFAVDIKQRPRTAPEFSTLLLQLIREHAREIVRAASVRIIDEDRLVPLIVNSRNSEADRLASAEEGAHIASHPLAEHFELALEAGITHLLQDAKINIVHQPNLKKEAMNRYISSLQPKSNTSGFDDIVNEVIKEYWSEHFKEVTAEDITRIVDNCTCPLTIDIPQDPVILHDLAVWRPKHAGDVPPEGKDLERAQNTATIQRHKIYSKATLKRWFRYRTIAAQPGVPPVAGDENTPDDQIYYQNAAGIADPNGYPIATNAKFPLLGGAIIEYPEAKFYDAKLLMTIQMLAAAVSINRNARAVASRDPRVSILKLTTEPRVISRYLNGLNPNTEDMEEGWLTQKDLDEAVTALNNFILDPYPSHLTGASDKDIKIAEYLHSLKFPLLKTIIPHTFIMGSIVVEEANINHQSNDVKAKDNDIKEITEEQSVPLPKPPISDRLVSLDNPLEINQGATPEQIEQRNLAITQAQSFQDYYREVLARGNSNEISDPFGENKRASEQRNISVDAMSSASSTASSSSSDASSSVSSSASSSSSVSSSSSSSLSSSSLSSSSSSVSSSLIFSSATSASSISSSSVSASTSSSSSVSSSQAVSLPPVVLSVEELRRLRLARFSATGNT